MFKPSFAQEPAAAPAAPKPAPAAQPSLPLEDLRLFAKAFENIRTGYVSEISDAKLLEYALKGMLSELDPTPLIWIARLLKNYKPTPLENLVA